MALNMSAAGEDVEPNESGTLYESRNGFFKYVSSHERYLGRANGNSEAVHPKAEERFNSETIVYQPRNLRRYLNRSDHKIAEV